MVRNMSDYYSDAFGAVLNRKIKVIMGKYIVTGEHSENVSLNISTSHPPRDNHH